MCRINPVAVCKKAWDDLATVFCGNGLVLWWSGLDTWHAPPSCPGVPFYLWGILVGVELDSLTGLGLVLDEDVRDESPLQ